MANINILIEIVKNSILNHKKINIEDFYNNENYIIIDDNFVYDVENKIYYSVYKKNDNVFLFPLPDIFLGF